MNSKEEVLKTGEDIKHYDIAYPASDYTFPHDALIHDARFDETHLHIELIDGRILSIPLWWIPTLYNATTEARLKFQINRSRTVLIWDPDESGINDEVRVQDYLQSRPA